MWGPERWVPEGWGPEEGGGPKFRAFFFHSPLLAQISFFPRSLGVFSWNCGRGSRPWPTQNAGLPPGLTQNDTNRNPHFGWAMALIRGHNSTRRPPEREERTKFALGEGKKSKILGGPAEGRSGGKPVRRRKPEKKRPTKRSEKKEKNEQKEA